MELGKALDVLNNLQTTCGPVIKLAEALPKIQETLQLLGSAEGKLVDLGREREKAEGELKQIVQDHAQLQADIAELEKEAEQAKIKIKEEAEALREKLDIDYQTKHSQLDQEFELSGASISSETSRLQRDFNEVRMKSQAEKSELESEIAELTADRDELVRQVEKFKTDLQGFKDKVLAA